MTDRIRRLEAEGRRIARQLAALELDWAAGRRRLADARPADRPAALLELARLADDRRRLDHLLGRNQEQTRWELDRAESPPT